MKKILLFLLTAAILTLTGAETAKPRTFQMRLVLTKYADTAGQFRAILPERPPLVPTVTAVTVNETFQVVMVFSGATSVHEDVVLEGKLTMLGPAGKKQEIQLPAAVLHGVTPDFPGIILHPNKTTAVFHAGDPKGIYTFQAEFTDKYSGSRATAAAAVELKAEIKPDPAQLALPLLLKYYTAPAPEYILPGFREYLDSLPKRKKKKGFNPLEQLGLFVYLLQDNPQCVPAFAAMVRSLPQEERFYGALVLNFTSEKAAAELTELERRALNRKFPLNPFEVLDVAAPWQNRVCLMEFRVRGNAEPMRKIAAAMGLSTDCLTPASFEKKKQPSPEDQRKFRNWLTAVSAKLTADQAVKQFPLAAYYLEAMLKRGELKNAGAAALTAAVLGMKVKFNKAPDKSKGKTTAPPTAAAPAHR